MPRIGIPTSFQTRPTGWPNAYDQVARMMAEVLRGGGGGLGPPRTMQPGPFPGALPLGGPGSSKTYGPSGQPFRTPPPQPLRPTSNLPPDYQGMANRLGGEYPGAYPGLEQKLNGFSGDVFPWGDFY